MIRAAAICVDITPDRSLELGGSWSRRGPVCSTGVDEALEANLLLLEGSDKRVILLSVDTLMAGPDLANDLAQRVAKSGRPVQAFALATHTHTAPMLDRSKPRLGQFDRNYYQEVLARLALAVESASRRLAPQLAVSTAFRDVEGSVGRRHPICRPVLHGRRVKLSGVLMGPNSSAWPAPACRVAVLKEAHGPIVCVLVSWACHPSDRPARRVSPDYVGLVRRAIRSRLGDHPVLFFQGFSGDVRGFIPTRRTLRRSARRLVRGPVFMIPTMSEWEGWAGGVATQIAAVAAQAAESPCQLAQSLHTGEASVPLSTLLGARDHGSCRACSLGIVGGLELFMMTAEVSAEYACAVERVGAWPIGVLDDVFGYFPADSQIPHGGYEVDQFRQCFGIKGRFTGNNDATFAYLLQTARAQCQETGADLAIRRFRGIPTQGGQSSLSSQSALPLPSEDAFKASPPSVAPCSMGQTMWTNRFQIVHFSTVHPPYDVRIFSKECTSLAKAGFSVTLLAPGDGSTRLVDGVTCRTLKIPQSRALRMTVGQLRMMAALFTLRADLFHFHDPELMPAALALRLMGRRVVFDSHEHIAKDLGEKPWLSGLGKRVAGMCGRALEWVAACSMSGIVITTPGMQRAYARGRTVLVRNLPKLEEFRELPAWEQRRPMACYVGLVTEFRGSRQIARLATRTSAAIVVAGRLPDGERRKLQRESGWRLVEYRGVLDRGQIVSLLGEAQIGLAILLPMSNFDDSIPTKVLEYLAAGIPVIASDFASWQALTHGFDCVTFVDPLDEEALARSVNALLRNPAQMQVMGRLGRELVLKRFVWEREFEALLSFYSNLLCPTRSPPLSNEQCAAGEI